MKYDLTKRLAKKKSEKFTRNDLADYVQGQVSEEAAVVALKTGKWLAVGNFWILLKKQSYDAEDSYAQIVTCPHLPFLNWLFLLHAKWFDDGKWVTAWDKCPGTNIIIDVWYVDDGSGGTVLAVETLNS